MLRKYSSINSIFFPTLFYTFAKYWFFYSDKYEQVEYLGKWCKQYSGLFYEVSYAAVIIAVSIVVMFVDLVWSSKNANRVLSIFMMILSYFALF